MCSIRMLIWCVAHVALAGLIEQNHAELLARECRALELAAAWADRHYVEPGGGGYQPWWSGPARTAGPGRRRCRSTARPSWVRCRGRGRSWPRLLIADALDLRSRLPRLWERVRTGGVRAWQARKIAEAPGRCHGRRSPTSTMRWLTSSGLMTWSRFRRILAAAILDADPEAAAERAERARTAQGVFSFDSEDGLTTIVAKATAGDAVVPGHGQPDCRDPRRRR